MVDIKFMKLTEIENPLVMDSSKPITVKIGTKLGTVIGYMPPITAYNGLNPNVKVETNACWHVLMDGDKPGYEKTVYDAEIIEE